MSKNQHTTQGNTNLDHSHTLKSLIEEQTRINEQGGKKILPFLLFLLSKLINEQGGFFVYYMKNCE